MPNSNHCAPSVLAGGETSGHSPPPPPEQTETRSSEPPKTKPQGRWLWITLLLCATAAVLIAVVLWPSSPPTSSGLGALPPTPLQSPASPPAHTAEASPTASSSAEAAHRPPDWGSSWGNEAWLARQNRLEAQMVEMTAQLAQLRDLALPKPQIQKGAQALDVLMDQVHAFPLAYRRRPPTPADPGLADALAKGGWTALWHGLGQALRAVVRIERIDTAATPPKMMSAHEESLFRSELRLRILMIRMALLSGDFALVNSESHLVDTLIARYCDPQDPQIIRALQTMEATRRLVSPQTATSPQGTQPRQQLPAGGEG
jgi:hypothetical protein